MIQLRDITLCRGNKTLLNQANITLNPGYKVGIIGHNGTGKSSLFELLLDQIQPDTGTVFLPKQWVIAHVAQETPALELSALDFTLDGDQERQRLLQQLTAAETNHNGEQIGLLHDELSRIDAYSAPARAGKLLCGLGFPTEQHSRPVSSFSGGWRMRLNLARALMCRSDLLLLDEPTNHLDLETVLWLENWLKHYTGTLLIISHDRDFLDSISTHIVELSQQALTLYTGNYSQFEEQRAERLSQQQAQFTKQQQQIQHLESFVRRFRAKASKAKQAQSRLKVLEKMEKIALAHQDSPLQFSFSTPDSLPNPLVTLYDVTIGYHDTPVLASIRLSIEAGSRIGLLGVNGAGKSTLVKLLAGNLTPMHGQLIQAKGLTIGYFAQHTLETLRPDETPLQHLQTLAPQERETLLRTFLGHFNFRDDMALHPVGSMSGGEKARLALALIIWQKPHLLLLDEPTNHLDMAMRHALTFALQTFGGALIVVSHDRYLLESTTDTFWLVHNHQVNVFDGDLHDYQNWHFTRLAQEKMPHSGESRGADRKNQRREEAEARQLLTKQRQAWQKKIAPLEAEMATLEQEKKALETFLASSEAYNEANKAQLMVSLQRQGHICARLEEIENAWLNLQEEKPGTQ